MMSGCGYSSVKDHSENKKSEFKVNRTMTDDFNALMFLAQQSLYSTVISFFFF